MTARSIRGTEEQGATFVELFFDLVFVYAVTQVTAVLAHDLTFGGVGRALVIFWLVWWAWTQYTWSLNLADTEHVAVRLLTLLATGLAFVMATTVPLVDDSVGWLFPVAYLVLRVVGIGLQWRLTEGDQAWTPAVRTWTIMSSIGLLAVVVAIVLPPEYRFWALAVAALLDINAALRSADSAWQLFTGHFSERHGLFVIIVLGESLIAAGLAASTIPLSPGAFGAAIVAVVASCGLWWTYFGWAKESLEERFSRPGVDLGRFARDVYSFAHFPIIAGVIGFAVGIEKTIDHPGEVLTVGIAVALGGGATLFLGGTLLALWLAGVPASAVRLVTIGLLVVSVPLLLVVPAWFALALVAALVVVLAWLETPTSLATVEPLRGRQPS